MKDFLNAATDIEKKLFKTIKELFVAPEKVIFGYIGSERAQYISAFRYLLLTIFLSYLNFEFFFEPRQMGGAFYQTISDGIKTGIAGKPDVIFDQRAFDIFFIEYTKIMTLFYKLTACFTIPAIFISFWIFFRKLRFNFACRLVTSTLLASQLSLVSLIAMPILNITVDNLMWVSYLLHFPMLAYLFYAMYRIARKAYDKILIRSFLAGLLATVLFSATNISYGIGIMKYLQNTTPKFVIKKDEATKKANEPSEKAP